MNEIATTQRKEIIDQVSLDTVTKYLDSTGLTKQLLPKEKEQFVQLAQLYGLNPFKREIYCTVFGEGQYRQCSIVTGYEVYLKRAERTGMLNGWNVSTKGSVQNGDLEATITIYRKDWQQPFVHTVYYDECVQTTYDKDTRQQRPNKIWSKMPRFMLKKVAMGQGFRLAFPDEFGGMPYLADEMPGEEIKPIQAEVVQEQESSCKPEHPAGKKQEPAAVKVTAVAVAPKDELSGLLKEYGIYMTGEPYRLAKQAENSGDEQQILAMIERVKKFLTAKRVMVA